VRIELNRRSECVAGEKLFYPSARVSRLMACKRQEKEGKSTDARIQHIRCQRSKI